MQILTAPDEGVASRAGVPFAPHDTTIRTADGGDLRIRHVDEGLRAMPDRVPHLPRDPSVEAQHPAWAVFESFERPFLCASSDDDPIVRSQGDDLRQRIAGAMGQPHKMIPRGGHFVRQNAPEAISKTIIEVFRATPAQGPRLLSIPRAIQ